VICEIPNPWTDWAEIVHEWLCRPYVPRGNNGFTGV